MSDAETTPGGLVALENGVLTNVHEQSECDGRDRWWGCWLHDPRPHSLDRAPVRWRSDRRIAERVCSHGVGHPDPQEIIRCREVEQRDVETHACCGCCGGPEGWETGGES